jgi:hypothetical protein
MTWYHHKRNPKAQKGLFPKVLVSDLSKLPIIALDLSKKTDKTKYDNLVFLVNRMLELKEKEADEPNQQLKTMISRQIDSVDKAIDTAVYKSYNLTDDEIKVVEGENDR